MSQSKKIRNTKTKKQSKEREELAHTLKSWTDKRFPSSNKMSTTKRLDRLEICTAQTLAVMDKLLEFWTSGVCPFTAANPDRPIKPDTQLITQQQQQQTDITAATTATASRHDKGNHPYL